MDAQHINENKAAAYDALKYLERKGYSENDVRMIVEDMADMAKANRYQMMREEKFTVRLPLEDFYIE